MLGVPPALVEALAGAGVTLGATAGATASVNGSTGYAEVNFPASLKPATDGVIGHKGTLQITSAGTGVTLGYADPWIQYPTSEQTGTAVLSGVISGLPDWMEPFSSALNGTRRETFNISDWTLTVKKSKVTKVGKNYKITYTYTGSGIVSVTDDQDSVNILNTALAGPGGALLTPGQEIGPINTSIQRVITCTKKKTCK